MVKAHPGRLVALRIHATNEPGEPPLRSGPIRNRDLADPRMHQVWRKAADLDLAIQMHFLPHHAPEIAALCGRYPQVRVILDHMGRAGMGTTADVVKVLALAQFPNVYFKYSGWSYFSNPQIKVADVVKNAHAQFGADRILWGTLGMNATQYAAAQRLFQEHWSFAPTADQNKVRGLTAMKLFRL
jgi:predicted TIM-barrel fold metal-dependent hydrolase